MESQVPISLLISSLATALVFLLGVVGTLVTRAWNADKAMLEKRASTVEDDVRMLRAEKTRLIDRLHADELATEKLKGALDLVQSKHNDLTADIEKIQATMVTRDMFEANSKNTNRMLDDILQQVRRYTSQSFRSPVVPRIDPQSDPPRR